MSTTTTSAYIEPGSRDEQAFHFEQLFFILTRFAINNLDDLFSFSVVNRLTATLCDSPILKCNIGIGLSYQYLTKGFMETYETREPPEESKNPLKGLGARLKLHVVIPIIYVFILITILIISHA
jgi:hypothetical protein